MVQGLRDLPTAETSKMIQHANRPQHVELKNVNTPNKAFVRKQTIF
jgi:hypothetical protein